MKHSFLLLLLLNIFSPSSAQVSPVIGWQNTLLPSEELWFASDVNHQLHVLEARGNNVFMLGNNQYEDPCLSPGCDSDYDNAYVGKVNSYGLFSSYTEDYSIYSYITDADLEFFDTTLLAVMSELGSEYDETYEFWTYGDADIAMTQYSAPPGSLSSNWSLNIGGDEEDVACGVTYLPSGNALILAASNSGISGEKTVASFGGYDYWLLCINPTGEILWQTNYGGDGEDFAKSIQRIDDNQFALVGYSASDVSGNKMAAHYGDVDAWVVMVDSSGNMLWDQSYGGSGADYGLELDLISESDFILSTYSASNAGFTKSDTGYGSTDIWILRLDSSGNVIWDKTLGSDGSENGTMCEVLNDSSMFLLAKSNSSSNIWKHESSSSLDVWILELDGNGSLKWEETIGSNGSEWLGGMAQIEDGNLIVGVVSYFGISGDKSLTSDPGGTTIAHSELWFFQIELCVDGAYLATYQDEDEDGYGDPATYLVSCFLPDSAVAVGLDCDDGNPLINPEGTELCSGIDENCNGILDDGFDMLTYYLDEDGDGYGQDGVVVNSCVPYEGYSLIGGDCNDSIADIHPGAIEICDGIDNDCNGFADDSLVFYTSYLDADSDGYGKISVSNYDCQIPAGYVLNNTDCNDSNADINPGADELCNAFDDNCNGILDDGLTLDTFYVDVDGDGYGTAAMTLIACMAPAGWALVLGDCNDYNELVNPDAIEICNYSDDNCNGSINEGFPEYNVFLDADGDGYGNPDIEIIRCEVPEGYVLNDLDCDDNNPELHPYMAEVCNYIDDDCDGNIDEDIPVYYWYIDQDGDGYGSSEEVIVNCLSVMSGYTSISGDCEDSNPEVHPGVPEYTTDGIDNNCDGIIDAELVDLTIVESTLFQIFPNPTSESLTIVCQAPIPNTYLIRTATGNIAINGTIYNVLTILEISQLPAGFYTLEISNWKVPFVKL